MNIIKVTIRSNGKYFSIVVYAENEFQAKSFFESIDRHSEFTVEDITKKENANELNKIKETMGLTGDIKS